MVAFGPPGVPMTSLLNDPRDQVFLPLIAQCLLVGLVGTGLYFVEDPWWFWGLAVAWFAVWGLGVLDRFILMLHCTSHRPLFKKEVGWLNELLVPWIVSPLMGQTPNSYFVHHIGMHHIEDNLPGDLSSTMRYRRDSFLHWLHYLGSFLFFGLFKLARYHWGRGTRKLFWRLVAGEAVYWSVCVLLCTVDLRATFVLYLFPVLFVRTLMMAGNWGQHAFIDPKAPGESWRSSITCINTRYNERCFNDGYHTTHHKKPKLHYTEHPGHLQDNMATFAAQDAIVFDGVDFFQVWFMLMTGQHKALARRMVRLPGAPQRSDEEVVAMFHDRLQPLPT